MATIRDYAKYLGLDYEDMVDEFNEYLFDYTSKISIEDIKKAKKSAASGEKEPKKIHSPYTVEKKSHLTFFKVVLVILVLVIIGVGAFFAYQAINEDENKPDEMSNVL